MSEYGDPVADGRDDPFEGERRGYNRRQVDEYMAMRNSHVRQLENRLSQSIGEIDRLQPKGIAADAKPPPFRHRRHGSVRDRVAAESDRNEGLRSLAGVQRHLMANHP